MSPALFTDTGIVVTASTDPDRVVLTVTDQPDDAGVRAHRRDHQQRTRVAESTQDPFEFARHQLREI